MLAFPGHVSHIPNPMSDMVDQVVEPAEQCLPEVMSWQVVKPGEQCLPAVMSWPLAPTTKKMEREIKKILAKVHAETDAAIAAEEAEDHETCPTCHHTKIFTKVVDSNGDTTRILKVEDSAVAPASQGSSGKNSARRPIGFKPAKKITKKA